MKKLSLYVFLLLMFCNVGFAECIEGDCINGYGTYTFADGRKYVGEWKNDEFHGQGTFTFADGDKYVGEFKDGKPNGQGTYTYADGKKYVGEWKDSEFHGQGSFTSPDGTKYVGEWKNDKRHGQGTYTSPDGTIVNGIWKDGKLAEKAKKKKTSSLSSKEAKLIKRLMETENWTEKQAKCLVKKTKPLVKKEDWNKYVKIMQQDDINDEDVEMILGIAFTMMAHYSECGVPPKQ